MSVSLLLDPFSSIFDSNGTDLAGTLEFYEAGTSTPLDTFTDSSGGVANANPLSLTGGRATVYGTDGESYKIVLKDSSGATLKTLDNIYTTNSERVNVDTISALLATATTKTRVTVFGYHSLGDGGGGDFFYDASQNKANHNGGSIIDPDIVFPSDWTNSTQVSTWFTPGSGTGCWVKAGAVDKFEYFGANIVSGGADTIPLLKALKHGNIVETVTDLTLYTSPSGNDSTGDGSSGAPYATLQTAYDALPLNIHHKCLIIMLAGTYSSNPLYTGSPTTDYPRNAVAFLRGKFISPRSQRNSGAMDAGVVIRGVTSDNSNGTNPAATTHSSTYSTILQLSSTLTYGIYNANGQIGLEDIQIQSDGVNAATALLASHRATSFVHCNNVRLTNAGGASNKPTYGCYAETYGFIEFTGYGQISYCQQGMATVGEGGLSFSAQAKVGNCDVGILNSNGTLKINNSNTTELDIESTNTVGLRSSLGGTMEVRGNTNKVPINSPIEINDSIASFVLCDIDTTVTARNSILSINTCDWQQQITAYGGSVKFDGTCNSYISPNTSNDSTVPFAARDGAAFSLGPSATVDFNGSGGDSAHIVPISNLTIAADATTINPAPSGFCYKAIYLSAVANRANCVISDGLFEGQELELFNHGAGYVQVINSTNANIATGGVKLSGSAVADEFRGIKLVWWDTKWLNCVYKHPPSRALVPFHESR